MNAYNSWNTSLKYDADSVIRNHATLSYDNSMIRTTNIHSTLVKDMISCRDLRSRSSIKSK